VVLPIRRPRFCQFFTTSATPSITCECWVSGPNSSKRRETSVSCFARWASNGSVKGSGGGGYLKAERSSKQGTRDACVFPHTVKELPDLRRLTLVPTPTNFKGTQSSWRLCKQLLFEALNTQWNERNKPCSSCIATNVPENDVDGCAGQSLEFGFIFMLTDPCQPLVKDVSRQ
jgi:hypothetical protein